MFIHSEKVMKIVLFTVKKNLIQRVERDIESLQKVIKSWAQLHVKRTNKAPGIGTKESKAGNY